MLVEVYLHDGAVQTIEVQEGSILYIREQLDDFFGKGTYSHYLNVL